MNANLSFIRNLLSGALLTAGIGFAAASYADDTEIFFGGQAIDNNIRPNVLFVLDNSGSMAWRTDSNNDPWGNQQSRMSVLKQAFSDIIMNTNGINAGLMVLNGKQRLLYPVTNIDNPLPSSATQYAGAPEIGQGSDDATQKIGATKADTSDTSLPMGYITTTTSTSGKSTSLLERNDAFFILTKNGKDYACRLRISGTNRDKNSACTNGSMESLNINPGSSSNYQTALFDFRSLNVPANVTIDSAYLVLTPTNSKGTPPTLNLKLEMSKTPAALNDSSPVGERTFNSASVVGSSWTNGYGAQFDITNQIKALQTTLPVTSSIGDVVLSFRATSASTDYTFCARNCVGEATPTLVVNYSSTATEAQTRMGALRFQNIGVPQGATITKAVISFVPATSNGDPVSFVVQGQASNDALTFGSTENVTSRPMTSASITWNAPAWLTESPPVPVEGPDVTAVLQEIVNRNGWCGNNAAAFFFTPTGGGSGSRTATSIEGGVGLQPTLTVTYSGGSGGCLNPIIETRVTDAKNDGFEEAPGFRYNAPNLGGSSLPVNDGIIAARYENLPITKNAIVLDAKLLITPKDTVSSPSITTSINFENEDNSSAFQATRGDFSTRNTTSAVSCTINNANGGWTAGNAFTCGGLAASLQSVFNRSGWTAGNALSLFMHQNSDSGLSATAYESNPSQSLRLRIKLANGGLSGSPYTVRNQLNSLVQSLNPTGNTPIVPTLDDAVNYLRNGKDGYPSPLNSACQTTHLVLLTDGQANQNTDDAKSDIASLTGTRCSNDASDDGEKCARTLATWMANNNQVSDIDGSTITTHTVGFALDASGQAASANIKKFLSDLATNGGGGNYNATTAGDLSTAFNDIIQHVISTDSTFVAASAPVNTFNRQDNKDELYFAVFRPQETDTWPGNLKRYRLDTATAAIVDADNVPAVNSLTGFFKDSARSFWSSTADGNNTAAGGGAANLPAAASRHLYTFIGDSPSVAVNLNQTNYLIDSTNTNLSNSLLGISDPADSSARTAAINYIRGLNATGGQRKALGDPLHSSPRLVTYACSSYTDTTYTSCATEDQSVVMATNEGYLHVFDTSNGQEQFAFMPEPLLAHIPQLAANAKSTTAKPRPYGMDNTVTLWVNDANKNGVIYGGKKPNATPPALLTGLNDGEFVYAYGTMGRGGRNIYALDITNRSTPKLLWLIKGGITPGFEQLGQTWSPPVKTKINIDGSITDVLIFAGGYDPNQDNVNIKTADTMGNAVYIVNASTGALIWSASKTSGTLQLSKMSYSMPSAVRVIDLQQNADGTLTNDENQLADQFFVGDMGGQIWRFYINNGNSASSLVTAAGSSHDGVFASVIPTDSGTTTDDQRKMKLRRFYNEPDVAILNVNGTLVLTVNIGSGYRGHPLSKLTEDRFYSFRTPVLSNPSGNESTLTESDLYDATNNLVQAGTDREKADASTAFNTTTGGWMIKMNSPGGEKVLTRALTVNGYVYFNTYEPTTNANSCQASVGINRSYVVNLSDATPYSVDGSATSPSARFSVVSTTGLLPDPTLVTIGGESFVVNGTQVIKPPQLNTSEYYWIDEDNL